MMITIPGKPVVYQRPIAGFCRYHKIWLDEQKILVRDCINQFHERQLMGYCQYFEAWETRTCEAEQIKLKGQRTARFKKQLKNCWNGTDGGCGTTNKDLDHTQE